MYGCITARKLRPGARDEYQRVWGARTAPAASPDASGGNSALYSLLPTDSEDEVWEVALFESREAMESFRSSEGDGWFRSFVENTL